MRIGNGKMQLIQVDMSKMISCGCFIWNGGKVSKLVAKLRVIGVTIGMFASCEVPGLAQPLVGALWRRR